MRGHVYLALGAILAIASSVAVSVSVQPAKVSLVDHYETGSKVKVIDKSIHLYNQDYTLTLWVSTTSANGALLANAASEASKTSSGDEANRGSILYLSDAYLAYKTGPSVVESTLERIKMNDGIKHFVAVTCEATNVGQFVTVYVDGKSVTERTEVFPRETVGQTMYVGWDGDVGLSYESYSKSSDFFEGSIVDATYENKAMTKDDVAEAFRTHLGHPEDFVREGLSGEQGDRGDKGDTGPTGDVGDVGREGSVGPRGPRGPTGPRGKDVDVKSLAGKKGERGPTGDSGAPGHPGVTGVTGPTGPRGEQGEAGEQGEEGSPGKTGPKGYEGDPGLPGPRGKQGAKGADGPKGRRGNVGDRGDQGSKGRAGLDGQPGRDGADGAPGMRGTAGERGEHGSRGPPGARGETGEHGVAGRRGVDGVDGVEGPRGARGDPGEKGHDGRRGARGEKGNAGSVGDVGVTGPDGFEGSRGRRGERGSVGTVGERGFRGDEGFRGDAGPRGAPGAPGSISGIAKRTLEAVVEPEANKIVAEMLGSGGVNIPRAAVEKMKPIVADLDARVTNMEAALFDAIQGGLESQETARGNFRFNRRASAVGSGK